MSICCVLERQKLTATSSPLEMGIGFVVLIFVLLRWVQRMCEDTLFMTCAHSRGAQAGKVIAFLLFFVLSLGW